jgi:hypothetical protein
MSRFPQTEPEVIALAHAIVAGLNTHVDDFPVLLFLAWMTKMLKNNMMYSQLT